MGFSTQDDSHGLLHAWQERMYESPWRFNQISDDSVTAPAGRPVYLQPHREIIGHAIASAFNTASEYLGFYPQPTYTVNEEIPIDQNKAYWEQTYKLSKRHLIEFGTLQYTPITSQTLVLTRADLDDSDDKYDHVYIEIGNSFYSHYQEIQVFFLTSELSSYVDLPGSYPYERYEIPVTRHSPQGSSTRFYMHLSDVLKPSIWNTPFDEYGAFNDVDAYDEHGQFNADKFISRVAVHKKSTNSTNAVRLLSMPSDNSVSLTETVVKPYYIDKQKGWFKIRKSDDVHLYGENSPISVRVSYLSGYPTTILERMNHRLEESIIRLANANMATQDIPLSSRSQLIWQKDTDPLFVDSPRWRIPQEYINPLGLLYGHIAAWAIFREFADEVIGRIKTW